MRYKQFLLNEKDLSFSLNQMTLPVTPRVFDNIPAINWVISIKKTKYTVADDEFLRNEQVMYIRDKSQVRMNKNSFYKEMQLVSKNVETFGVPDSGAIIDPEFINVPSQFLSMIQDFVKAKGQDFMYKIDVLYSDDKVVPIVLNRLPIYLWGKVILEVEDID